MSNNALSYFNDKKKSKRKKVFDYGYCRKCEN